jgi:hypothetical protein
MSVVQQTETLLFHQWRQSHDVVAACAGKVRTVCAGFNA